MQILPLLLERCHGTLKLLFEFLVAVHHVVHLILLTSLELLGFLRIELFELSSLVDELDKAVFFGFCLRVGILWSQVRKGLLITGEFNLQTLKEAIVQAMSMLLHSGQVLDDLVHRCVLVLRDVGEHVLLGLRMNVMTTLLIIVSIGL